MFLRRDLRHDADYFANLSVPTHFFEEIEQATRNR
jgi:hypothetical protein